MQGIDYDHLVEDFKTQDALLRRYLVIGEAAKGLSKEFKENHKEIPWREIAGLRDIIVHRYHDIDLVALWRISYDDLPELKNKLKQLI